MTRSVLAIATANLGGWVNWLSGSVVTPPELTLGRDRPTIANTRQFYANNPDNPANTLTVVNGDFTTTSDGQIVQDLLVKGRVLIQHSGVTCINVHAVGTVTNPTGTRFLFDTQNAAALNATFIHCSAVPQVPHPYWNGWGIKEYTALWCYAADITDAFSVYTTAVDYAAVNVKILGCFVPRLAYFSPSPTNGDNRTHNDCCQIQSGRYIEIAYSDLRALVSTIAGNGYGTTAEQTARGSVATNPYAPALTGNCISITSNGSSSTGTVGDVSIHDNWLDGGATTLTMITNSKDYTGVTMGEIKKNRFGRTRPTLTKNSVSAPRPILADSRLTFTNLPGNNATSTLAEFTSGPYDGNVYDDDGSAVRVSRLTS